MPKPLYTFQEKTDSPYIFRVYWYRADNCNGIVDVDVRKPCDDPGLIAELCAIQYLYFDMGLNNGNIITSGKGHKFYVSNPEILALANEQSFKKYAWPFIHEILLRLRHVEIEHSPVNEIKEKIIITNKNLKFIFSDSGQFDQPNYAIDTPVLGKVHITKHALDQYIKRTDAGIGMKNELKSLILRLKHPELRQLDVGKGVQQHKSFKYGNHVKTTFWGHERSIIGFTIIENGDRKTLVTVYRRDLEFQRNRYENRLPVYWGNYL